MLLLKDIYVGDVDAKDELLTMHEKDVARFRQSFTLPGSVNVDDYISGKLFYVTGLKGTGKTALLRFLSLIASDKSYKSRFILFKSHVKESDRALLKKNSDTILVEEGGSKKYIEDYENVWMLFLHKAIVNLIEEFECEVFHDDAAWKKYKWSVLGADYGNKALGVLQFFPQIKKGLVSFFVPDEVKPLFENEVGQVENGKINFSVLVSLINDLFARLNPKDGKVFLFVDELELNLGSKEQYKRDVLLIRDLIVSVDGMNRMMAAKGFPVKICCAVRREVISAVEGIGKEIAKPTEDFGVEIVWNSRVGGVEESFGHPLVVLLAKKIYVSSLINGEGYDFNVRDIFERYFPSSVNGVHVVEFLLNRTWYRPRDLSRMLRIITKQFGESDRGFLQKYFEDTQKVYARSSWTEIAEELAAKYDKGDIKTIERVFSNIDRCFNFDGLEMRIKSKFKFYSSMTQFVDSQKLAELLEDLFSIGFIGNCSPYRFHFRGDSALDLDKDMMVHRALWPYLSIIDG